MRYRMIPALGLLAVTAALVAACSSSASPSPSSSSASAPGPATPTEPPSASASGTGMAGALPAADCAVVKPIAAGAIETLAPLQTESANAAAGVLGQFIGKLSQAQGQVSSPQAKADLGALISALSQATTNSTASQTAITSAIAKLGADCP